MSSKDTNRELRKEEYSEVSANLRHIVTFALLFLQSFWPSMLLY